MTPEKFDQEVKEHCEKIVDLLSVKGVEYRRNNDVYHNFHRTARITGETPERALLGFAMKHLVSILDIVDDLDKGIVAPNSVIEEKCMDLSVYTVILKTMLKDRNNDKETGEHTY